MPKFKCYKADDKLMAEGINTVPLAAFFEQLTFEEDYPGLYSYTCQDDNDAARMYGEVKELAAEWGFAVE